MQAYLYGLVGPEGCSWHVSLDLRADRHYWLQHYGKQFRIRVLEPALSFGQAYGLQKGLVATGQNGWKQERWLEQARLLGLPKEHLSQWKWWDWSPSQREEPAVDASDMSAMKEYIACISEAIHGRFLLYEEFERWMEHTLGIQAASCDLKYMIQLAWLSNQIQLEPGVTLVEPESRWAYVCRAAGIGLRSGKTEYRCQRCGCKGKRPLAGQRTGPAEEQGLVWSYCIHCAGDCPYCERCLTMGRARCCTPVLSGVGSPPKQSAAGLDPVQLESLGRYIEPWGLSNVQTEATGKALLYIHKRRVQEEPGHGRFLIWAVTGAGKTEMIFPLIAYTLSYGGKVAVATPRRDVVLELKPRLAKAFSGSRVVTLYGGSEDKWESGHITIATTHQLLRFRHAFELVVIDEIDAYPYHNNAMLEYAAEQVCSPGGTYILLSATPPVKLQRQVRSGKLPHARVAARYHRHPLPVPRQLATPKLNVLLNKGKKADKLLEALRYSLQRGAQVFVFVPYIAQVEPAVQWLRRLFPQVRTEGTSSKDAGRAEKVAEFRSTTIRMLVTTTILERGVTIPRSDVYILDADSSVFDAAALVQMAGRAGRSAQDPKGQVCFAAAQKTRSQKEAVRQIREMNRIALQKGYIHKPGDSPGKGGASQ